ncbi:N-succinylglutamate 5-semialdehyde dehydrogenase [Botrimarina hoheduenensis]|uniref:N-succinylglutamate 5-semialdehyde dehydrogenase n=1 Tax=Botrimarina hoheduenensis TaxID=2528000 RepID=A0A5C5WBD9_9BACT|nr:N-succinylglutamate 5-semialdehyde dehydrogenase [Botrimarina hoheduenensis]
MNTNFINGKWTAASGSPFTSTDPYNGAEIWSGAASTPAEVATAVEAARAAFPGWALLTLAERAERLRAFEALVVQHEAQIAELISREVGKPLWEAKTEATAMHKKIGVSIQAMEERCGERATPMGAGQSVTRFKPHGVVGVFGPFNFPAHLPNGHIVPALLAGNTVVFKPSELTPAVGQKAIELWEASGLPAGVINLVQGARETGVALASNQGLDGLFFTGSSQTGKLLHEQFGGRPDKVLALEMGGNNPLVIHDFEDVDAAVYLTLQSAYVTAGQRCVCAGRLILTESEANHRFLEALLAALPKIRVGHYTEQPEPFMGPLISAQAAEKVLAAQESLQKLGGKTLYPVERKPGSAALLGPGLIDMTDATERPDDEVFGPLLQLVWVKDFDAAIEEANRTAYGLSASLVSRQQEDYDKFYKLSRAGVVNWNQPTTGAASTAPFGGVGMSGNHNPSAYFAADYCAYPVASIEQATLQVPAVKTPGLE